MPFAQLLGLVADPPKWTPSALPGIGTAMNTTEFLVHHEDIRRAALEWVPRRLSEAENRTVWAQTRVALLPFAAKAHGPLRLSAPGSGTRTAGSRRNKDSAITITGERLALLLYRVGREAHALVSVRWGEAGPGFGKTRAGSGDWPISPLAAEFLGW